MGDWLQLAGFAATLVWGAATVRAELRYVRRELHDFKIAVEEGSKLVAATLRDHGERISRIEGRLGGE